MLIVDCMKSNVVSISPDTTLLKCRKLFKENKISRLPVVDVDGVVVGLVSVTDLKAYTPQNATPMAILEAIDMLEEVRAKDVMSVAPRTIYYKGTVDQAALLMIENDLNCLPVVGSDDKLMGILTEWDIFKSLVDISGVSHPGADVAFTLENKRGTLREILDQLKDDGMRIASVLSNFSADGAMRQVKIRFFHGEDATLEKQALEKLKSHPGLRYWAYDGEVVLSKK